MKDISRIYVFVISEIPLIALNIFSLMWWLKFNCPAKYIPGVFENMNK